MFFYYVIITEMAAQKVDVMKHATAKKVLKVCAERLSDEFAGLVEAVADYSRHPTTQDAIAELSRSEFVFISLVLALSQRELEVFPLTSKPYRTRALG